MKYYKTNQIRKLLKFKKSTASLYRLINRLPKNNEYTKPGYYFKGNRKYNCTLISDKGIEYLKNIDNHSSKPKGHFNNTTAKSLSAKLLNQFEISRTTSNSNNQKLNNQLSSLTNSVNSLNQITTNYRIQLSNLSRENYTLANNNRALGDTISQQNNQILHLKIQLESHPIINWLTSLFHHNSKSNYNNQNTYQSQNQSYNNQNSYHSMRNSQYNNQIPSSAKNGNVQYSQPSNNYNYQNQNMNNQMNRPTPNMNQYKK